MQATAPISLSGLAPKAASSCLSRTARLRQFASFQVHPGERGERRGVRVRGRRPLLFGGQGCCCLVGQFCGVAQSAAHDFDQREAP